MSERSVYFFFVLARTVLEKDPESGELERALINLASAAARADLTFVPHNVCDPQTAQTALRRAASELPTGALFRYWFRCDGDYDLAVALNPAERMAFVSVNVNFFLQDETVAPVLTFLRHFYEHFAACYGYGPVAATAYPTDIQAIDDGRIPGVYYYNFLGPQIVEHYGAEQLKGLPAWQIDTLRPSGLLIALVRNPLYGKDANATVHEELARTLDLGLDGHP